MLVVKTGMQNEYEIAIAHAAPTVRVLTGIQTLADLEQNAAGATAIISFGMCGGLKPGLPVVGQTIIAWPLITPAGTYKPDEGWVKRLFAKTHAYCQPYLSSGLFNTAETPAQRAQLFEKWGAWAIDDESIYVAQFAQAKNIPFAVIRNVSDAADDNVSITSNTLKASGGINPLAVIADLVEDPEEMIAIGRDYSLSNGELNAAAVYIGSMFQAPQ